MNPLLFYEYGISKPAGLPFISTWKTDNVSTGSSTASQVKLPLIYGGTYAFNVDWGDGTSSYITSYNQAETLHNYASSGTYTITITGTCKGWCFDITTTGDRLKILSISSWGGLNLGTNQGRYFYGCTNLNLSGVSDVLNLAGTTSLDNCFAFCTSLTTVNKINEWNTSEVTNMGSMFKSATLFNQPIGNWNTSAVTYMGGMFTSASSFNQPIGNWNVSSVTDMTTMFAGCTAFNQNIGTWNVSSVYSFYALFHSATNFNNGDSPDINTWQFRTTNVNMTMMFYNAKKFNQNIGSWNVSGVTNMASMFEGASVFNQNIGFWNVSEVTSMERMFHQVTNFNQDISSWNVSKVTDMSYMFRYTSFNQDIGLWNVAKVTNMYRMFSDVPVFNKDISLWNVSNVTDMSNMFSNAKLFDQNIGSWNVSNVSDMSYMFQNTNFNNGGSSDINNWQIKTNGPVNMSVMFAQASLFNQDISSWNVSAVTNMSSMFSFTDTFNKNIGSWNVSSVTDMSYMFNTARAFNQNIGLWNVSNVTDMSWMFRFASEFNQPIGNWNTSKVQNMNNMFNGAWEFNQDISKWDISNVINFSSFMPNISSPTFPSATLDAIYNGWSSRPVKPSISISFGSAKYTAASTAGRAILTGAPNNWVISDGGT